MTNNLETIDRWAGSLKNKMRRLNWSAAVYQINSANRGLAYSINMFVPSFKRFLDNLALDMRNWKLSGRINPATMSIEAFESAEATARAEYAYIQQMMANQSASAANSERRRAATEVQNAERRARQAAANAQRTRNAAARRNAMQRNREAVAARKAAKEAENEARFAAAEKQRMEATRRKANNAALKAKAAANKAARKAKEEANKAANGRNIENFLEIKRRLTNNRARLTAVELERFRNKLQEFTLPASYNKNSVMKNVLNLLQAENLGEKKPGSNKSRDLATIRAMLNSDNKRSAKISASRYKKRYGNLPENIERRIA